MKAMLSKHMRVAVVVVLVALLTSLVVYVLAQPPGGFQGGNQPPAGMRGMMMGGPRGMGGAAIAVSGDAVFVVANGMLLKYDAETLELLAQAELPMPEMQWPQPPPAPGQ